MSTWTSVSKLSIIIASGDETCDIYANGKNQIPVVISVAPTDENGDPIDIGRGHVDDRLKLIDYITESELDYGGDSGWCYTESENSFSAIPGRSGGRAEVSFDDDGTYLITYYVYCSPGVSPKSIGIQITTDSGSVIKSSMNGTTYHSKIKLNPRKAVVHKRADVDWDCARTSTGHGSNTPGVSTDAWNYYLSLKSADNNFVTFYVNLCFTDPTCDGLFASRIPSPHFDFYGGYVWYHEPHDSAYYDNDIGHNGGLIVNFPTNGWADVAKIYDRDTPNEYLCFTWVHAHNKDETWDIPNDPLTSYEEWYTLEIDAWDRYGNMSKFWVAGSEVIKELNLYDTRP